MSTHSSSTQQAQSCSSCNCNKGSATKDIVLLVALFAILFLGLTWLRPLASPDEGRYTEIPREMLASGDWVQPTLNGFLYFYKPPLVYWLEATAISAFGNNLVGLRLVPALFGIIGIIGTYLAGRHWYGRATGMIAAFILGTSVVYCILSQLVILDMGVAAFMAVGLFAFFAALLEENSKRKRDWLFRTGMIATALALMCKGLMAIAIPGAILFLWILLLNQWHRLKNQAWVSGILLFALISLPWHILAYRSSEHWFDFYIIHEHFLRYLTDVSSREQPFWFFIVLFPVGLLPWTLFLPQAWLDAFKGGWGKRKERPVEWAMAIWAIFILLFFSMSKSKLIPYVLPMYPALALLVARYIPIALHEKRIGLQRGTWGGVVIGIGIAIAMPIVMIVRKGQTGEGAILWLSIMAAGGLITALAVAHYAYRKQTGKTLVTLSICLYVMLFILPPVVSQLQRPGTRELAEFLKPHLTPNEQVFCYADYGIYQDFPFYLDRVVGLTRSVPTEQNFGFQWDEAASNGRLINEDEIPALWKSPKRVIMLARNRDKLKEFPRKHPELEMHIWKDDGVFTLFSNRPLGEGAEDVVELPEPAREFSR